MRSGGSVAGEGASPVNVFAQGLDGDLARASDVDGVDSPAEMSSSSCDLRAREAPGPHPGKLTPLVDGVTALVMIEGIDLDVSPRTSVLAQL